MFFRISVPMLVLAAGVASVIVGAFYHEVEIFEEVEETVEILAPPVGGFLPLPGVPGPENPESTESEDPNPFVDPPAAAVESDHEVGDAPPPMLPGEFGGLTKRRIVQKDWISKDVSEPQLNREVTIGGVVLAASGALRQTYSGVPPSLCPT